MPAETPTGGGLRTRKKARTRQAIEQAGLELFAANGYDATTVDDIAARADVSTTTFFRYFANKAEVLLAPQSDRIPQLEAAIRACPAEETDLEALRRGVQAAWVDDVDPERLALIARATAASYDAQGMRNVVGSTWFVATSSALADRKGLSRPDGATVLGAQVGLLVFASLLADWVAHDCSMPLREAVDRGFALMADLCRSWSSDGTEETT